MNIYAFIILSALLIDFMLSTLADWLNIKSMNKELPLEMQNVYNQEDYQKSQAYTRERTRFGLIISAFDLALLLTFWFSGGFNWLDQWIREWTFSPIATGLLYIGLIIITKSIITLPFSIYSTFVIEEKYGFNKTTAGTFVTDLLKGLVLSIIIGGPILSLILYLFEAGGQFAWLFGWIAVTLFTLLMQYIAPTWIMPLFNTFKPLENVSLKEKILNYAKSVDYSLANIFVMDGSKRSSKSNAFFTGFGKNKRIALFDTLIEKHTEDELLLVLAHEIGHYKKKHIIKNMMISILHTGILFYLLSVFLSQKALFDAFYVEQMSVYAGLIFFGMLYAPVEMILSIFMNMLSRKHEFEADAFAAETTGQANTMIDALKKLSKDNLSNLTPHPFYTFLHYSHPPVLERIKALQST